MRLNDFHLHRAAKTVVFVVVVVVGGFWGFLHRTPRLTSGPHDPAFT